MTVPTPTTENPTVKAIRMFRAMADLLERNQDQGYAGAAVICHPDGENIEFLLLGSKDNEGQFFATLMQRIQITTQRIDDANKQRAAFGHR